MVGLKVGPIFYKIGNGSFLHAFFSTVAYNLENNNSYVTVMAPTENEHQLLSLDSRIKKY